MVGALAAVGCGSDDGESMNIKPAPSTSYEVKDLLGVFDHKAPCYRTAMKAAMDAETIDQTVSHAGADFAVLVPHIPYVGPLEYPLPMTLVESAVALSLYRVLKARGMSAEDAGKVIVDAFEESLRVFSKEELLAQGEQQFTQDWYKMQAFFAGESQKRCYPGDWVYDFVQGEPENFNWGLDFTECGIYKLYKAQGVTELMPFLCVQDFILSRHQGTGLARTGTLAGGADRCDFRYKKGREIYR